MKSSRLLSLLLLLQTRTRMSTAELAERLEVSRRTILRDVEALSAAGVPVYAERGRSGGIVLLPGARLNVSHLSAPEMEALETSGLDESQRDQLGIGAVHETAARKIRARSAEARVSEVRMRDTHTPEAGMTAARGAVVHGGTAARPAHRRPSASAQGRGQRLADIVVVDNAGWYSAAAAGPEVSDLALDLRNRRRWRIRYRRSGADGPAWCTVDPYGLAAKSGRWYLVAEHAGEPRLFSLERLESYETLQEPARTRPGESLRTVWGSLARQTQDIGQLVVTARLRRSHLDLARRLLGSRILEFVEEASTPAAEACRGGEARRDATRGRGGSGESGACSGRAGGWEPPEERWCILRVGYREMEAVRQLLQFGDHIEVLDPPEARTRVAELAADLFARHRTGP